MPCDAVRNITLDLKVANRDVLKRGLKAAGWDIYEYGDTLIINKGRMRAEISGGRIKAEESYAKLVAGEVKQAYATEAVRTAAKQYGWSVVTDRADQYHLQIMKK